MDKKELAKSIMFVSVGALVIYLVYLWINRGGQNTVATLSPQQSAGNTTQPAPLPVPAGGNFTVPPISIFNLPAQQQNVPNPSGSGVPTSSPQAQLFANAPNTDGSGSDKTPAPSPGGSIAPGFFLPMRNGLSNLGKRLAQSILPTPLSPPGGTPIAMNPSGAGCGCGGDSCKACTSDCSSTNSRFPDGRGDCMAMNRKQQTKTDPCNSNMWQNYQDNVTSRLGITNRVSMQFDTNKPNMYNTLVNMFGGIVNRPDLIWAQGYNSSNPEIVPPGTDSYLS